MSDNSDKSIIVYRTVCLTVLLLISAMRGAAADDRSEPEPTTKPRLYDGLTLDEWRERIKSLEHSSEQSTSAIPGLIAIVRDSEAPWFSRRQAALTLGRMGPKAAAAVPLMQSLLKASNEDENTRLWAIKSLALFGAESAEATPMLVKILNDERASLLERAACIDALGRIGPANPLALSALADTLNYQPKEEMTLTSAEVTELRALAAEGLALNGGQASVAVPSLVRALRDDSELVRRQAADTLGAIGPSADVAVPNLVESLVFDETNAVQDSAAVALGRIGPAAIEDLVFLLSDRDPEIRWRAAAAFLQMGRNAQTATPELRVAADDASGLVRIHAIEALWAVAGNQDDVVERLHRELGNDDRQIRIRSVRLLTDIAKRHPRVVILVEAWATQDHPTVQAAARQVLLKLNTNQ